MANGERTIENNKAGDKGKRQHITAITNGEPRANILSVGGRSIE